MENFAGWVATTANLELISASLFRFGARTGPQGGGHRLAQAEPEGKASGLRSSGDASRSGHPYHQPIKTPQHSRDLLGLTLQKADTRFHACTLLLVQPLGPGYVGLGGTRAVIADDLIKLTAGFFPSATKTMNQKLLVRNILVVSVLFVFCSCASPAKEKRLASGGPSAGARIGKGAVNGLRYLVGAPLFVGMAVFGPLGGAPPSAGLEMLQKLHDYELPDGPPKPESGINLPPK